LPLLSLLLLIRTHSSVFFFFFSCYVHPRALLSFPTRRSSDLILAAITLVKLEARRVVVALEDIESHVARFQASVAGVVQHGDDRSEEHTSELQSPDHLVCRLLLEKKKKQKPKDISITNNQNTN